MFGTLWEIFRRDVADISANLAGNLVGFIVSMTCCVVVFLCIQNNLKPTLISAELDSKHPMTMEYDQAIEGVSIHGAMSMVTPSTEAGFYMYDMLSFPMVTDVGNYSLFQERQAMITQPMIQRQLDGQNQPTPPGRPDQVGCSTEPSGNPSRISHGRINYHVKYKPLS